MKKVELMHRDVRELMVMYRAVLSLYKDGEVGDLISRLDLYTEDKDAIVWMKLEPFLEWLIIADSKPAVCEMQYPGWYTVKIAKDGISYKAILAPDELDRVVDIVGDDFEIVLEV